MTCPTPRIRCTAHPRSGSGGGCSCRRASPTTLHTVILPGRRLRVEVGSGGGEAVLISIPPGVAATLVAQGDLSSPPHLME